MRLSCTKSILERRDVVIVATVSAIYGIGEPESYHRMVMTLRTGDKMNQRDVIAQLVRMQYQRNEQDFARGKFRVRGDTIDVFPAEHSELAIRIELFDDEIESLQLFDPLTGRIRQKIPRFTVYPSSHYVTPRDKVLAAVETIKLELDRAPQGTGGMGKLVEAQRLEQRTRFDLEMLSEVGHCKGIENYTRHLSGAAPGDPPSTLTDYLPKDAIMFLDESHQMIGQLGGMYNGDRARKTTLVEYGFRLPSALDNRPLKFEEFEQRMRQASLCPPRRRLRAGPCRAGGGAAGAPHRAGGPRGRGAPGHPPGGRRAAGDPHPRGQARARADHHADQAHGRAADRLPDRQRRQGALPAQRRGHRGAGGNPARPAPGHFDVLVGINLLREGLDIPEVSLVAILDADKEGFLRSERSLIQTIGRAARNLKRPRHPVCRPHDRLDGARHRRDQPPAGAAGATTSCTASRRAASSRRCAT
jgi:excinuclease ABC subunit B